MCAVPPERHIIFGGFIPWDFIFEYKAAAYSTLGWTKAGGAASAVGGPPPRIRIVVVSWSAVYCLVMVTLVWPHTQVVCFSLCLVFFLVVWPFEIY